MPRKKKELISFGLIPIEAQQSLPEPTDTSRVLHSGMRAMPALKIHLKEKKRKPVDVLNAVAPTISKFKV